MLLLAGRTAITERGLPTSRSQGIHWAQESFDQAGLLREFVKWDYELRRGDQLETVVDRALAIACSPPAGPVYLTLPLDVIGAPMPPLTVSASPRLRAVLSVPARPGRAAPGRRDARGGGQPAGDHVVAGTGPDGARGAGRPRRPPGAAGGRDLADPSQLPAGSSDCTRVSTPGPSSARRTSSWRSNRTPPWFPALAEPPPRVPSSFRSTTTRSTRPIRSGDSRPTSAWPGTPGARLRALAAELDRLPLDKSAFAAQAPPVGGRARPAARGLAEGRRCGAGRDAAGLRLDLEMPRRPCSTPGTSSSPRSCSTHAGLPHPSRHVLQPRPLGGARLGPGSRARGEARAPRPHRGLRGGRRQPRLRGADGDPPHRPRLRPAGAVRDLQQRRLGTAPAGPRSATPRTAGRPGARRCRCAIWRLPRPMTRSARRAAGTASGSTTPPAARRAGAGPRRGAAAATSGAARRDRPLTAIRATRDGRCWGPAGRRRPGAASDLPCPQAQARRFSGRTLAAMRPAAPASSACLLDTAASTLDSKESTGSRRLEVKLRCGGAGPPATPPSNRRADAEMRIPQNPGAGSPRLTSPQHGLKGVRDSGRTPARCGGRHTKEERDADSPHGIRRRRRGRPACFPPRSGGPRTPPTGWWPTGRHSPPGPSSDSSAAGPTKRPAPPPRRPGARPAVEDGAALGRRRPRSTGRGSPASPSTRTTTSTSSTGRADRHGLRPRGAPRAGRAERDMHGEPVAGAGCTRARSTGTANVWGGRAHEPPHSQVRPDAGTGPDADRRDGRARNERHPSQQPVRHPVHPRGQHRRHRRLRQQPGGALSAGRHLHQAGSPGARGGRRTRAPDPESGTCRIRARSTPTTTST